MRKQITILAAISLLMTTTIFGQTVLKEYKAGHIFYVSLPDYMTKTIGINTSATIQFKNTIKDIGGFIIEDNKEELKLADLSFSSIDEFYDNFIKDFLVNEKKRNISPITKQSIGERKFIECDASYYDKESKLDIYYFIGIAETKDAYYKVLCYGAIESKDKYKSDFQKILYSIRD